MPRGIPKSKMYVGPSENLQRLLDMQRELKERIDAEVLKDRARALLLEFATKHALSAQDLRAAAKVIGERKVGDAPVHTKKRALNTTALKPAKGKLGKAIRAARLELKMSDADLGARVGAHGSTVSGWQAQGRDVPQRYHARLLAVLKLPPELLKTTSAPMNGHATQH